MEQTPGPLSAHQTASASIAYGRLRMAADLRMTPLGLLAVGALVSGILLSVPPIIRAAAAAQAGRRDGEGGVG